MTYINCHICQAHHNLEHAVVLSQHETSEGTVVYARCPLGHLTVSHALTAPLGSIGQHDQEESTESRELCGQGAA